LDDENKGEGIKNANKSEISLVHEIALKRNMAVNFEVIHESGPPHLRVFCTRCTCGDLVSEGEANSKQLSKRRAAECMLDQLDTTLPLVLSLSSAVGKAKGGKTGRAKQTKAKNLVKVQKASPDYGVGVNPISRLAQVQQAKKDKEPEYKLLEERGLPRLREFVIQVSVGDHVSCGVGPNKKLAKRHAAEQMLQLLGYSKPCPQPSKSAIKTAHSPEGGGASNGEGGDRKVTFRDPDSAQAVRQLVPGVIVLPTSGSDSNNSSANHKDATLPKSKSKSSKLESGVASAQRGVASDSPVGVAPSECSNETTAAIVNQFLNTGSSSIMEAMMVAEQNLASGGSPHSDGGQGGPSAPNKIRPKDQLLYLASLLGFNVQFTDFPKGNKTTQYLSIATLSTNPPQHAHGSASTLAAANDNAALLALKNLGELGLDGLGRGRGHHGPIKSELV
jgi:double-stranded RNA-binding protein Staufen